MNSNVERATQINLYVPLLTFDGTGLSAPSELCCKKAPMEKKVTLISDTYIRLYISLLDTRFERSFGEAQSQLLASTARNKVGASGGWGYAPNPLDRCAA